MANKANKAKKTKKDKKNIKDKKIKLNNTANINNVTLDDLKNVNNNNKIIADKADNPYKIGDIVLALAGRDEDRLFAVVGIIDKDYVLISNGRSRRVDFPKKKKIRHIKLLKEAGSSFAERVEKSKSGRLTNLILRNVINEYVQYTVAESQNNQVNQDGK